MRCEAAHAAAHLPPDPGQRWAMVSAMREADLPQLWELGNPADLAQEAADLSVAERAQIGLADRLRGSRGRRVRAELPDRYADGVLLGVFRDAFVLAEPDGDRLVTFAYTRGVDTQPATPSAARGRERGSGLTVCRDWVDRQVVVWHSGPEPVTARLCAVGSDHLEIVVDAGVRLLPWVAIAWVSTPVA